MRYGISCLSIIPVRSEPSEKSEMCTQILFGEHYTILEETKKWCKIKLAYDGYEGWIDQKMVFEISEKGFHKLNEHNSVVTSHPFNLIQPEGDYSNSLIVAGSNLPFYRYSLNKFKIAKTIYQVMGDRIEVVKKNKRKMVIEIALKYFNAPYLWGGRSPFGIDCSGFSQIVYKQVGIRLPRDASEQATCGEHIGFVEETLPGDLAFFDNEEGKIIHVGIVWERGKIIHSSGKVRIDNFDQFGIVNIDTKRYTHQLRLIKRFLPAEEV